MTRLYTSLTTTASLIAASLGLAAGAAMAQQAEPYTGPWVAGKPVLPAASGATRTPAAPLTLEPPPTPAAQAAPPAPPLPPGPQVKLPPMGSTAACPLFPDNSIFHQRIDDPKRFPVHARSDFWLGTIGKARRLHPDWGHEDDPRQFKSYYGIPYNRVTGKPDSTQWLPVSYETADAEGGTGVPSESDCAVQDAQAPQGIRVHQGCETIDVEGRRFPFPHESVIKLESGQCNDPKACGDRHLLVIEEGACRLWEAFFVYKVKGRWQMYASAHWDLRSNQMRPSTWTSADAAGLPITPFLARADEASKGEVRHPLRVTFRDGILARQFVWPATHAAGNSTTGGIPFGAVMRLRADAEIPATWTRQAQALARAMKTYGLYVADIGSDFFIQGEPSAQWDPSTVSQLRGLRAEQFEFIDTQAITSHPQFKADSFRSSW